MTQPLTENSPAVRLLSASLGTVDYDIVAGMFNNDGGVQFYEDDKARWLTVAAEHERLVAERTAKLEARVKVLEEALTTIRDQHIGDCPLALAHLSDEAWARQCYNNLRSIARAALENRDV